MNELEKQMYFGAIPSTFQKATHLRNKMTHEENVLWERLKGKQICGVRFRRQHPINTFIADFYCHKAKLVVEIDGKIHLQNKEYDIERTKIINNFDIKIIRFKNEDVLSNTNEVVKQISDTVKIRLKVK